MPKLPDSCNISDYIVYLLIINFLTIIYYKNNTKRNKREILCNGRLTNA